MTIYVHKDKVQEVLAEITAQQARNNLYLNVAVKPYKGKKYNQAETVTIKIG